MSKWQVSDRKLATNSRTHFSLDFFPTSIFFGLIKCGSKLNHLNLWGRTPYPLWTLLSEKRMTGSRIGKVFTRDLKVSKHRGHLGFTTIWICGTPWYDSTSTRQWWPQFLSLATSSDSCYLWSRHLVDLIVVMYLQVRLTKVAGFNMDDF